MSVDLSRVPNTKNKAINEFLASGVANAQSVAKGEKFAAGKDAFGETNELLPFEILRASGVDASRFKEAGRVHSQLERVFRDDLTEISQTDYLACLALGFYGLILQSYDEEDFRYLYRYSLSASMKHEPVMRQLRRMLVFEACTKHSKPREVVDQVLSWVKFLGTPYFNPNLLVEPCGEFGLDIQPLMEEDDFKLVDSLKRHSEYLEEALTDRPYVETRNATESWLPDALSSRILGVYRKKALAEAQAHISPNMKAEKAFKTVQNTFKEIGFEGTKGSVLPVKLQELPSPPEAPAVDPVVFEMIPQKLRVGLLPSVAYSTKTKRIEVIFIGGARIGHSGILIKTDTGGVLIDYGLSVANQRIPEWVPELEMIDTVLVTHSHLDHVGGLPILYENYTGKWCSVSVTGAVTMALLEDAVRVGTPRPPRRRDKWDLVSRFKERNIEKVSKNHVRLEIGKSSEVGPGILVTPVDACHIPGSASYIVDIEGVKILYTGDFNADKSALFEGATLPTDCDMVIFDATYWGREDFDRQSVSDLLMDVAHKSGPVIIPTFAVGRSQEILVTLDTLGITEQRNVITTGLAERVTKLTGYSGKWQGMKKNKVALEKEDILVSGGGMMSGGPARQHFKEHRNNPDAAIIPCGYLAPRTPGWNLIHGYEPHECRVEYARLSAHSSASNLRQYINSCSGKKVMVHTPHPTPPKGVVMPGFKERIVLKT
jgi:putative mRNA 3-end processing factor